MGHAHTPTRSRRPALLAVVHLLFALSPSGASAGLPTPCPSFCECKVTVEMFFMVTCARASLQDVPRDLPRRENTTVLDLQQNQLNTLRENALDGFTQLQFLYLNHSQVQKISERAFHQCIELRSVFLAGNNLKVFPPKLFESNNRLQLLDLSHNTVFLPTNKPFLISRSLLILNLTATRLSEVPVVSFTRLRQLKLLDLRFNLLKSVEVGAVDFLRNATLMLHYNPLRCDCILRRTWRWQQDNAPPPPASPPEPEEDSPTCVEPQSLKGTSLDVMMYRVSCGEGNTELLASQMSWGFWYSMIGVAALLIALVVVAVVAVVAVRRGRQKRGAAGGGPRGIWCRPKRLAPPVGEYIEVIPDNTQSKKPVEDVDAIYEVMDGNMRTGKGTPQSDGNVATRDCSEERYVSELTRSTYIPPSVPPRFDEPVYVNMKGPPLPERGCSNADVTPDRAHSPLPPRPCSVPLLEGCDFYEVVD